MISFRQKIFITYVGVFLLFIALMVPFVRHTVQSIVAKAMEDRATEIIKRVQDAPDDEALVQRIKDQKPVIFFRVSVITDDHKVLYDTHTKRLLKPNFNREYVVNHPEVLQAFQEGKGYTESYSKLLGQRFAYMAKAFDFHGKTYVLRTAFPYLYVAEVIRDFEIGFIGMGVVALLLFSFMTWVIINYLTRPIRQLIKAIEPYQEGKRATIPEIKLKPYDRKDEFGILAQTLNSMKAKIDSHINLLTQERNDKEAVLESLGEGVIGIDQRMIVTYANNTGLKFLHLTKDELIGKHFYAIGQEKCQILLERCQSEKKVLSETLEMKNDGDKSYYNLTAAPKKDKSGAILVIQDATSHFKMIEMRKDFIANASHELKTPITIIQGFAETLHDNPELPLETTQDITHKIMRNCKRMYALIKDLLALSDVERLAESRLIECDLFDLTQQCVQNLQNVYPDANIQLKKPAGQKMILFGDPSLLELAVTNLLDNAVKYSQAPATIMINFENIGDSIKLSIADQGIGIPKEDIAHIYERFFRVNKVRSQKMGGSGLGLSIVHTIIDKHYGKISVQSEIEKGTTFTIVLPIKRAARSDKR